MDYDKLIQEVRLVLIDNECITDPKRRQRAVEMRIETLLSKLRNDRAVAIMKSMKGGV